MRPGRTKNPLYLFAFNYYIVTCPSPNTTTSELSFFYGMRLILSHVLNSAKGNYVCDKALSFLDKQLVSTFSFVAREKTLLTNAKTNMINFIFYLILYNLKC